MENGDHERLVNLYRTRKILIGVDRTAARNLFIFVPIADIATATGYAPYLEKIIVYSLFVLGPIALLATIALACLSFGWWGLMALIVCPVLYLLYYVESSMGRAGPYLVSGFVVVAFGLYGFGLVSNDSAMRFIVLFLFSLWCARMMYVVAARLYRAMALRNARLFHFPAEGIDLKQVN